MWIPYSLDYGYFPFIVQPFEGSQIGVEGQLVIYGQDLVRRDLDVRAIVKVLGIVIGDDGIQTVVATRQLQDYQDRVFLSTCHTVSSSFSYKSFLPNHDGLDLTGLSRSLDAGRSLCE